MSLTIAVDFDGVLHDPYRRRPGSRLGAPVDGAQESMARLRRRGHHLIVHTCRPVGDVRVRNQLLEWGRAEGIGWHDLTNAKPLADVYLDDRAVRFENWEQALAELLRCRPFAPPARRR